MTGISTNSKHRTSTGNRNRTWTWLIGLGLALFPVHNFYLTQLATNSEGVTQLFLPAIGAAIWIISTLWFVTDNWEEVVKRGLGDKRVYIPLLVIVVSIGLSGIYAATPTDKIAPLLMGGSLFALYLTSRILGPPLFRMIIPFVILGAVVSAVIEIATPGSLSGGIITNSCAAAGFLILGALINQGRRQWILCSVALAGVLFIGALEGLFVTAVVGTAVIVRRDFNRWFWAVAGIALAIFIAGSVLGYLTPIYASTRNLRTLYGVISGSTPLNTQTLNAITTGRWTINLNVLRNLTLFGHGFTLAVGSTTAHNIPLIIADQVGIPAALAWTFVTLYCLIKTKWKYVWIAVIATGVWDHYLWTQFLPWFWVLVGVSTTSKITTDLIFRKAKTEAAGTEATGTEATGTEATGTEATG